MKSIQIISQDLFDKVRSRFTNLEMGDGTGAVTIDPAEARFFDFDFVLEGNNLGRVSMSLNDLGILKVYYSQGITENQDSSAKQEWFNFLKEMRMFAMRRLLRFDTRDISKNNLDKNDFQHLATTQGTKEEEQTMNESRWNHKSSKKTSRAVRGNTEVIVRHANPVEETYPGARSQRKNIKAIFIQNRDGERYKYPFIHTAGAFAMAQHVDHGGVPHDAAGKHIIRMSEQIAQLQEFQRQVRQPSLHSEAHGITERAVGRLQELKAQIASLGQRNYYESWMETFNQDAGQPELLELDAVAMEQYKSKFTETNFKEELAAFFPLIHSIMQETDAIDLEDYVGEGWKGAIAGGIAGELGGAALGNVGDAADKTEGMAAFEQWAEAVEQGKLTPDQVNNLKRAVSDLTASGNSQPLGDHGEAAWDFFNGAAAPDSGVDVFSDDLHRKFEVAAEEFPETDALEVFTSWAQSSYPELLVALGMSGEEKPAEPAAEPPPVAEVDDGFPNTMMPKESQDPRALIKEVAKIVKSFYNRDNPEVGPFRGGEGIAIDVEKSCTEKFGEAAGQQAREMAEAFMEKLTNEWQDRHGQVDSMGDDGLARLKELVGNIKSKVESIGDIGGDPGTNIMSAEDDVAEGERTMSRAAKGYEKYGKDGMQALAKAGREGDDLDKVRDKYNKYDEDVADGSMPYPHGKPEAGDKITWYHSNHYPEIEGTVVGWKDGHLIVQSIDPSPRNTEKTVAKYRVPKNSILSVEKQGAAEGSLNKGKISEVSDDVTKARNLGFKNASKGSPMVVTDTCPYNRGTAQYKAYWRGVEQYNEANPKKIKEAEQGMSETIDSELSSILRLSGLNK